MSVVTQAIFLAIFGAAGFGVGEMVGGGGLLARLAGTLGGLLAGLAVRDLIREKLGSLEDEGPREPPSP